MCGGVEEDGDDDDGCGCDDNDVVFVVTMMMTIMTMATTTTTMMIMIIILLTCFSLEKCRSCMVHTRRPVGLRDTAVTVGRDSSTKAGQNREATPEPDLFTVKFRAASTEGYASTDTYG